MIDLVVPVDVVLERLAARRVCTDCATNYSVDNPPRYGWVCDNCGGEVVQRADDTPEAIQKRLDLYERETAPLIAWYKERGLLQAVDGLGAGRRGHRPPRRIDASIDRSGGSNRPAACGRATLVAGVGERRSHCGLAGSAPVAVSLACAAVR